MSTSRLFLRITNNSEKVYAEKLGRFFSGLLFRANFFESSPGLISGIAVKSASSSLGYAIDPMTYVFSVDPNSGTICRDWRKVAEGEAEQQLRSDLKLDSRTPIDQNWIRPIPTQRRLGRDAEKVEIFGMRQSFRSLADKTLNDLSSAAGIRALSPKDFTSTQQIQSLVASAIDYQLGAVKSHLLNDKEKSIVDMVPVPTHLFCPYFCITSREWLDVHGKLWSEFDSQCSNTASTIVIFTTSAAIRTLSDLIVSTVAKTRAANIALWVDNFDEEDNATEVVPYAAFINKLLQTGRNVINLYGGGYSLLLSCRGLSTVVSCGHGESKQMEPLSGGYPVSKYYIPSLRSRRGIGEAVNLLSRANLGATRAAFLKEVCSCAICKDAIKSGVADLVAYFGELGKPIQTRRGFVQFPTGRALKHCKFHYLLCRIKEHQVFARLPANQVQNRLSLDAVLWRAVPNAGAHLDQWLQVSL